MNELNEKTEEEKTPKSNEDPAKELNDQGLIEEENEDQNNGLEGTSVEDEILNEEIEIDSIATEVSDELLIEEKQKEITSNGVEESKGEEEQRLSRQLRDFHKNQIEAALYASGKPLSVEIISTKLEIGKKEVEKLVNELAFDYLERSTALVIAQIGDRYQMQIKPEYTEKVSKFAEGGAIAERYLRTLTVIALKQPIMKSLVIKLRGSGAYEHVKYLMENALIDAVKKGRSQELTTTEKYAEMFGLPKDREEMKRVMIAQLGLEDAPTDEQLSEPEEDIISEEFNETENILETEEPNETDEGE